MIRLNKLLLMITTRDNNVIIMKTEESNNECRGKVIAHYKSIINVFILSRCKVIGAMNWQYV